jgi:hypothetical protein
MDENSECAVKNGALENIKTARHLDVLHHRLRQLKRARRTGVCRAFHRDDEHVNDSYAQAVLHAQN